MRRRPPVLTRTATLFPDTTLFRSSGIECSSSSSSQFHGRPEPAPDHALAVERHALRIHAGEARVGHHLLVDAIALRARLVDDPCKHHDLAGLELDALRERGVLARLDIVGNAFDVLQRAMLFPDLPCLAGQVAVGDKILLWNRDYETVDVTRVGSSLRMTVPAATAGLPGFH